MPIVREQSEAQFPGLRAAVAELGDKIADADMRKMNYAVVAQRGISATGAGIFAREAVELTAEMTRLVGGSFGSGGPIGGEGSGSNSLLAKRISVSQGTKTAA